MPRRVVSSPMAFNRVPGGLRAVALGCLLVNCGLSLPTITPSSATRQITTADPFSYQTPQGVKCQTRDFLDIAAGDLDKVADAQGNNHDEVVLADAGPGANGQLSVNVTVLNYATPGGIQNPGIITATATHTINVSSFTNTADNSPSSPLSQTGVAGRARTRRHCGLLSHRRGRQ